MVTQTVFAMCEYDHACLLTDPLLVSWLLFTLKIKNKILARNDQQLQCLHLFIFGIPFLLCWLRFLGILFPCGRKGSPHEALYLCHVNGSQPQFPKLYGT